MFDWLLVFIEVRVVLYILVYVDLGVGVGLEGFRYYFLVNGCRMFCIVNNGRKGRGGKLFFFGENVWVIGGV